MGRKKLTSVRREADARSWLDSAQPLPDDATIAGVSTSMTANFVLDALEQALYVRRPGDDGSLIRHSDLGAHYVSIRYSERLAEAGFKPSVGNRGDSYDNALAETINGLYKAELNHRRTAWKTCESVELATLERVV